MNYSTFQFSMIKSITSITIITLTLTLYGCSNPLSKKVFEPLTVKELKKSMDNDTAFQDTYELIQQIKDSVLRSDIEKAKFADLTYKRVFKLLKYSKDSSIFNPIREQLKKEWKEKYGSLHIKVDSISNYWKNYKDKNSLNQYVQITLTKIDKEYYEYVGGVKNINLGFELTPLKGTIEQLRFGYRIEAKINEKEHSQESIYSSLSSDKSWCLSTSPFSTSTVRYWQVKYPDEKILESKTTETFLRDYNIYIEVDQIRKDGKNFSNDDLNIPNSVENHWQYENNEYLKDLYVKDILKDLMNIDFIPEYEFVYKGVKEKLIDKDALAFAFLAASEKKEEDKKDK